MGKSGLDFREIGIELIDVGVQQLRVVAEDDSIGELAEDIATNGLLQPIGVSALLGGRFQLLWGSRRIAAHCRLSRKTILARVMPGETSDIKALALVENLHRQQLTLDEEVAGVVYMVNEQGRAIESVASALSKSRSWVLNRLMVPDLPEYLREPLLTGDLKMGHIEVIAQIPGEGGQRYVASQVIQNRWSIGQTKQVAEIYKSSPGVGDIQPIAHAAQSIAAPAPEIVWSCEACGIEGKIGAFRLARVCANGCQREPDQDRATTEDGRSGRLEGDKH